MTGYTVPTITKEQYKNLIKLGGQEEVFFNLTPSQAESGDLLSVFLKEYATGNRISNILDNANLFKLLENIA